MLSAKQGVTNIRFKNPSFDRIKEYLKLFEENDKITIIDCEDRIKLSLESDTL